MFDIMADMEGEKPKNPHLRIVRKDEKPKSPGVEGTEETPVISIRDAVGREVLPELDISDPEKRAKALDELREMLKEARAKGDKHLEGEIIKFLQMHQGSLE